MGIVFMTVFFSLKGKLKNPCSRGALVRLGKRPDWFDIYLPLKKKCFPNIFPCFLFFSLQVLVKFPAWRIRSTRTLMHNAASALAAEVAERHSFLLLSNGEIGHFAEVYNKQLSNCQSCSYMLFFSVICWPAIRAWPVYIFTMEHIFSLVPIKLFETTIW